MPDYRERVLQTGVQSLGDAELLALLLETGSTGEPVGVLAASLLESAGGLHGVARLGPHGLAERRGVGKAKAVRVVAGFELGRRAEVALVAQRRVILSNFTAVADWAKPRFATLDHEEVWLLALDGRGGLKCARRIAQGGLHGCALTARDVLGPAFRDGATAIVLVHNHPSGDPHPSVEDLSMTRTLVRACDMVGIPLLDHVVVAREGADSALEPRT